MSLLARTAGILASYLHPPDSSCCYLGLAVFFVSCHRGFHHLSWWPLLVAFL